MDFKKQFVSLRARACIRLEQSEQHNFAPDTLAAEPPFKSTLKIAVVKQSSYCDLYTQLTPLTPFELLSSSIHRTGPIGLFLAFQTDFIIVKPCLDEDCQLWREKLQAEDRFPEKKSRFGRIRREQEEIARSVESVDWSNYDLVIAIENAIPARITQKYPKTLWATQLEHHGMSVYKSYLKSPPVGYDIFLHLRFGPHLQLGNRGAHVVDFPYCCNHVGGLREIYSSVIPETNFVFLEDHQDSGRLARLLEVHGFYWGQGGIAAGSLVEYQSRLASSRVFLAPNSNRPLGGLASLDAAAFNILNIGNRFQTWNPYLTLPEMNSTSEEDAVDLTVQVMGDNALYESLLEKQNARLNWFGWRRPLAQIANVVSTVPRELSIRAHLN